MRRPTQYGEDNRNEQHNGPMGRAVNCPWVEFGPSGVEAPSAYIFEVRSLLVVSAMYVALSSFCDDLGAGLVLLTS